MAGSKKARAPRKRLDPETRKDRIIDVAIRLAEEGGFENVRQRDVAAQAGVALGTLYKSFRGKEDILSAALERETDSLERRLEKKPTRGDSPTERVASLFQTLTRAMCRKPNYARAVLRTMASGEPDVAANVIAYQTQVNRMIVAALRGADSATMDEPPSADEFMIALMLQQIWFAALVGWSAKLHGQPQVVEQVRTAARLMLAGLAAERAAGQTD